MTMDPWLAGELLDPVKFPHNSIVEITRGEYQGQRGWLVSVTDVKADPLYTVELASGGGDIQVRQSMLRLVEV